MVGAFRSSSVIATWRRSGTGIVSVPSGRAVSRATSPVRPACLRPRSARRAAPPPAAKIDEPVEHAGIDRLVVLDDQSPCCRGPAGFSRASINRVQLSRGCRPIGRLVQARGTAPTSPEPSPLARRTRCNSPPLSVSAGTVQREVAQPDLAEEIPAAARISLVIGLGDRDQRSRAIMGEIRAAKFKLNLRVVAWNPEVTAIFQKVPEGYIGFVEELPGA